MECFECGNDSMHHRQVDGRLIYECEFCGALEGEAAAVGEAFLEREADDRGLDPLVYPLVEVLEKIATLRVREASPGVAEDRIPPYVYFHIEDRDGGLRQLEQILQSLEMSHRRTNFVWAIEAHAMHGELRFALRPRFMKLVQDLDPDEIHEAQNDLKLLADRLRRDMGLSWWR